MLLGILASFLGSCSKDNNEIEITNTGNLSIGDLSDSLSYGELFNIQELTKGELYAGCVYLLTPDFKLGSSSITGTGNLVEIILYFNSKDYLVPGLYTIDSSISGISGTFKLKVYKDFNISSFEVSAVYQSSSGNMTISKTGSVYEISIDVLADRYILNHADENPTGDPTEHNINIILTYNGNLQQRYFS